MKNLKHLNLNNLSFFFIIILFVFGRVFMGLNIFSLRLGEILMGLSSIILLLALSRDLLVFKSLNKFQKKYSVIFFIDTYSFFLFTCFQWIPGF